MVSVANAGSLWLQTGCAQPSLHAHEPPLSAVESRGEGWGGGRRVGWGPDIGLSCVSQITFICDLLLLYVDGEANFYWMTKYEEVSYRPAPPPGAAPLGGCWPEP